MIEDIYIDYAQTIIALKDADLELRDRLVQSGALWEGYNEEMEQLHNNNAVLLNDIIDVIGYPTADKVGEAASAAAWLVIQHAIGKPDFMKKCAELLETAVRRHRANPEHLACLTDRIAVLEGKNQRYGTQFDWDENGVLNPNPFDDLAKVNQRRKSLGLNSLEEQTAVMRMRAEYEQASPPPDLVTRRQKMDAWRKKTGWIK